MRVHKTPNMTPNMTAWSRFSLSIGALTALGAAVFSGCGSSEDRYYCDLSGCYTCDGYGCTPTSSTLDAGTIDTGSDAGTPDTGSGDGGSDAPSAACTKAAECSSGKACVAGVCQECGGVHGPCACAKNTDCPADALCVGGVCTVNTNACQYPSDCATGEVCVSGKCETACGTVQCPSDATCVKGGCQKNPTGPVCATGAQCAAPTPYCVGGQCVASCTDDPQCGAGYYCNQGACQPDTRPQGNCQSDPQCDTAKGQKCVRGICKYPCATDAECVIIDNRIAYCGVDKVCRSFSEAHPQCTSKSDCAGAQDCVGNTCQ